jgi:hypothetical protein
MKLKHKDNIRIIAIAVMMKMLFRRRNIVVQVSVMMNKRVYSIFVLLILEAETETINHELEKQFNEGLQSKIAHIHHGGLGFHGDAPSASSSDDWQHQSAKAKFVPAKTEVGSSIDHVKVNESEKVDDQTSDKQEKKTKSKS